ncbi:hypothetical protein [Streptosporangium sp. CA-115845]|uniref:hypothetical protein n=1 Tax=Streptosporangium sp. CA-115845 TaxID=3240071 RepID=UPI003D93D3C7
MTDLYTASPFDSLVFSDALTARLLEKLAPAAAADLRATLPPPLLKQVNDAIERHAWRHRWCECCHA